MQWLKLGALRGSWNRPSCNEGVDIVIFLMSFLFFSCRQQQLLGVSQSFRIGNNRPQFAVNDLFRSRTHNNLEKYIKPLVVVVIF